MLVKTLAPFLSPGPTALSADGMRLGQSGLVKPALAASPQPVMLSLIFMAPK